MKPRRISPFLFVALGVSLGLFGFFLLLANPFGWKLPVPTLKPVSLAPNPSNSLPKGLTKAPTPYLILPHGIQTYNSRGAENKISKVTSITYDPLDPPKNTNQTISATIQSIEPVNSVALTVHTDNQINKHSMTLSSGDTQNGVWTAFFTVTDTYEKFYDVSFEIITELGNKTTLPMLIR